MKRVRGFGPMAALLFISGASSLAAQESPVERLVLEAFEANHLLRADRYREEAADAESRSALGALLPAVSISSRYSEQRGGVDLGDFINPTHAALNDLLGTRLPTGVELTLPQRHHTRIRVSQLAFAPGEWARWRAAEHQAESRDFQRRAAARDLAAQVKAAYYAATSADRAVLIHRATYQLTREAERVAMRLLEVGNTTPDVVLRARAERSEVEQTVIEAESAARAALRELNRLTGRSLDSPLDSIDEDVLTAEIQISREQAVTRALSERDEIPALEATAAAASSVQRVARSNFLPRVAVTLEYGVQGQDFAFDQRSDYLVGSVVVSWDVFRGPVDAARIGAARAEANAVRARLDDLHDRIRVEVLRAHDAATAAHAAISVADARLTSASRAYELLERRYAEGTATNLELIDARRTFAAAQLNRTLSIYRYAMRRVELERAAALRPLHRTDRR